MIGNGAGRESTSDVIVSRGCPVLDLFQGTRSGSYIDELRFNWYIGRSFQRKVWVIKEEEKSV